MADMARETAAARAFVGTGGTVPKAEAPIELDAAQYGELKPYKPSIQDRLGAALVDLGLPRGSVDGLVGSSGVGRSGPGGMGLADFSPFGALFAVDETFRAKTDAERTAAIMGVVPGSRPAGKAAKEGVEAVGRGIRAFHGSPHSFDKFDASKMGTGEGTASRGRGLYFAQEEQVAANYRDLLQTSGEKGNLYEVTIDANPEDFLDFDIPVGKQPKTAVRQAARSVGRKYGVESSSVGVNAKGSLDIGIETMLKDPETVERLRQKGVVGVQFMDAHTRSGLSNTRNYVVFPGNEHLIEVVRKYGVIGLLGTGAAAAMVNDGTGQAQAHGTGSYTTAGGV